MRILITAFLFIFFKSCANGFAAANDERVFKIYHDADWSNNIESSESIWRGMQTALSEVDYTVNDVRIELVKRNHGGNVTRSLGNMKAFLDDDRALAVFSGMHSPPLITNRSFINENRIPVLVPWAAGGPITRYPSAENSVFRLSVDDTKAGEVLVDYAVKQYGCSNPYLLLENTKWGDSNDKNIKIALEKRGASAAGIKRFSWGLKSYVARSIIQEINGEGAKCVILVSSVAEGAQIALAMSELDTDSRLPIISHWGITGGNFHLIINAETRALLELSFIQTCFSFIDTPMKPMAKDVFEELQSSYPEEIRSPKDIRSPVGFIHAYDLTKLFITALNNVQISDDIQVNRNSIKIALENIEGPVEGLIKTYRTPFTQYDASTPDAHEALGRENICMGSYGRHNEILVNNGSGI